jgi:acylglycerol lipase
MKTINLLVAAAILATTAAQVNAAPSTSCADVAATLDSPDLTTYTTTASDGTCLRGFAWKPTSTQVRGVVVITHGIRDYAMRYDAFARKLNAQGYAVYAQDLRGHAHSGGARQRFDSMKQLVADGDLAFSAARSQYPTAPLFAFGHSLGGLVTTEYALAHGEKLSGVVLTGAALMRPASVGSVAVGAAKIAGTVTPGLNLVKVDDSEFSRDPEVMKRLADDPLVDHGKLPAASVAASIRGMAEVHRRMGELNMPLLVMYGLDDKVNPTAGSDALFAGVKSTDKALKTYMNVYHDMLHEPERDQIASDIITWLNART